MKKLLSTDRVAIVAPSIYAAAAVPAALTSTSIDTINYNQAIIALSILNETAAGTYVVTMTECATTDGDFTAVAATVFAANTTSVDDTTTVLNLEAAVHQMKRFVKVVVTSAGSSSESTIYGTVTLGDRDYAPASTINQTA